MNNLSLFRSGVKRILKKLGYSVAKYYEHYDASLDSTLKRISAIGLQPRTIIDIGASNGIWTQCAQKYFSQASYLLIEANHAHESDLSAFINKHPNCSYELVAASEYDGTIFFDGSDLFGGRADVASSISSMKIPCRSIDSLVSEQSLVAPFMLKLDTHGFERAILRGAQDTLGKTMIVMMEVYNFRLSDDCALFWEICEEMNHLGFRPGFLAEAMHRPLDGLLWQMDLAFVKKDLPGFTVNTYQA